MLMSQLMTRTKKEAYVLMSQLTSVSVLSEPAATTELTQTRQDVTFVVGCATAMLTEVLLYVHRNRGLIRDGTSP